MASDQMQPRLPGGRDWMRNPPICGTLENPGLNTELERLLRRRRLVFSRRVPGATAIGSDFDLAEDRYKP